NVLGVDVRGDAGIAKRAHQDRIELPAEHGEAIAGHSDAVGQVAIGAPIKMRRFEIGAGGFKNFDGLRDDFFSNAVAGDDSNFSFLAHAGKITQSPDESLRAKALTARPAKEYR